METGQAIFAVAALLAAAGFAGLLRRDTKADRMTKTLGAIITTCLVLLAATQGGLL